MAHPPTELCFVLTFCQLQEAGCLLAQGLCHDPSVCRDASLLANQHRKAASWQITQEKQLVS